METVNVKLMAAIALAYVVVELAVGVAIGVRLTPPNIDGGATPASFVCDATGADPECDLPIRR